MKNAYIDGKNNFFASANTRFGFYSCFDDVFNRKEFEKIYIIKGGSGTGKSSLMKKIREKCEREGITSQGILCSSDPDSLDGLIAGEKTVAFIDGTSPHTTDPVYPGAIDRMVDLGNFWNEDILRKNKSTFIELNEKKKECITRAYKYLKAVGDIYDDTVGIISQKFDFRKMKKAINRFFNNEFEYGNGFEARKCFTSCFNRMGRGQALFFESMSNKICTVENDRGVFFYLMEEMISEAKKRDIPILISYDCFDPEKPDGIYFPENSICVTRCFDRNVLRDCFCEPYKIFNMERFISADTLHSNKEKLRFGKRCMDELLDASAKSFEEAYKIHSEIEKIYISAMDFSKKESFTEEIMKEFENITASRK